MKKTYITPEVLETSMDISDNLLSSSPTAPLSDSEATTIDGDDTTYDTLGRGSSWDKEDDGLGF